MTSYEMIKQSVDSIITAWGSAGESVIANAFDEHRKMTFDDFLNNCIQCGGNWGAMLLSGMKKIYPKTYEAIPENMGINAFTFICETLALCGVIF